MIFVQTILCTKLSKRTDRNASLEMNTDIISKLWCMGGKLNNQKVLYQLLPLWKPLGTNCKIFCLRKIWHLKQQLATIQFIFMLFLTISTLSYLSVTDVKMFLKPRNTFNWIS